MVKLRIRNLAVGENVNKATVIASQMQEVSVDAAAENRHFSVHWQLKHRWRPQHITRRESQSKKEHLLSPDDMAHKMGACTVRSCSGMHRMIELFVRTGVKWPTCKLVRFGPMSFCWPVWFTERCETTRMPTVSWSYYFSLQTVPFKQNEHCSLNK